MSKKQASKFKNVDINDLTDAERRDLLKKINQLVFRLPSFLKSGVLGSGPTPYVCCLGDDDSGHEEDCSIGQLNDIFGY